MNTYPVEFYDLLYRALGGNDSARLQGFLDEAMAAKYNTLDVEGFRFNEDMQLDFTYEQIQKEVGLNVMASYVDLDSPAKPFSTEGAAIASGSIPRMKAVEYWNEDKYRKMLITEQRFGAGSDRVANAALRGLFNTVDTLVGAHTNSLTYQRHQIVSAGKFTITDTNNPGGYKNVTFANHVPSANIKNLSGTARWWTSVSDGVYATEGSACDPIGDLQKMVKVARKKGVVGHFEINDSYADQVLGHSKVKSALASYFFPAVDATIASASIAVRPRDERINALGAIVGAPIKCIDSQVSVEKFNTTTGKIERPVFDAFESNVLVFVPDGNIGEILTVEPLKVVGGTYGSFYGGRLLLTVGVDAVKKCQSYNTEMTSLVVPNMPQYMWYIHPYSA